MPTVNEQLAAMAARISAIEGKADAVAAVADAKIAEVSSVYANRISMMIQSVYVNQATGLDTNSGTADSPIRTIDRALAMTPLGGTCTVVLQGAYATGDADIVVNRRFLSILSNSSIRHALSFNRRQITTSSPNLRALSGFNIQRGGAVTLNGVRLNVPALDGNWATYQPSGIQDAVFRTNSNDYAGHNSINIGYCDVDMPNDIFGALVSSYYPTSFWFGGNAMVGQRTSPLGALIRGYTATAGTAATTVAGLVTNLTQI